MEGYQVGKRTMSQRAVRGAAMALALAVALIAAALCQVAAPGVAHAGTIRTVNGIQYQLLNQSAFGYKTHAVVTGHTDSVVKADIAANVEDENGVSYPVTEIKSFAFSGYTGLTSMKIPASVRTIGYCAFFNCTSLKSVAIAKGSKVSVIGDCAFESCTSLKSITLAASSECTTIGWRSFYGCTSLTSVKLPASVQKIDSDAFRGCTSLGSLKLSASLQTIDYYAFDSCTSLTSVTIPASVRNIAGYAFNNCLSLAKVSFVSGSKCKTIGDFAFYFDDSYGARKSRIYVPTKSLRNLLAGKYVPGKTSIVVYPAAQPAKIAYATKTFKASTLKKKARTVSVKVTGKMESAKVTYKIAKKAKSNRLSLNAKTGKVTVKKGTKKGTYKMRVKASFAATSHYKKATKYAWVVVRVK